VLRFEAPLPLTNLPAGRYVVSIEASSSAGGDPVSRGVPFRVR
jgi:ribosomal protein L2